jgi:hypothetical protein
LDGMEYWSVNAIHGEPLPFYRCPYARNIHQLPT